MAEAAREGVADRPEVIEKQAADDRDGEYDGVPDDERCERVERGDERTAQRDREHRNEEDDDPPDPALLVDLAEARNESAEDRGKPRRAVAVAREAHASGVATAATGSCGREVERRAAGARPRLARAAHGTRSV